MNINRLYQLHFLPKQQYIVPFSTNIVFDRLGQQPKKYVVLIGFEIEHIYKDHVAIIENGYFLFDFNLFSRKPNTCFS